MDRVPPEVLALCAQLRELARLENQGVRPAKQARAIQELAKPGATRIFKQLAKRGMSIHDLTKAIEWNPERTIRLVAGEEIPGFFEIPAIATAIGLPVSILLDAYGYPKDTFQSAESLAQAVLMEAERA